MQLSKLSLRTFFHNVYNLFVYDYHQYDLKQSRQMDFMWVSAFFHQLQSYSHECGSAPYRDELDYIMKNGVCNFPYEHIKTLESVETGFDTDLAMPFVVHHGKKLYFPGDFTVKQAEEKYRQLIETENLLGGGYTIKAPHQYQTESFKVEEGDVFVDVGAAEGLVALDVVEKASKLYLVESEAYWLPALRATFEPYRDKCKIINKLVSDKNSANTITLDKLLGDEKEKSMFVKMDIEGFETRVLVASRDFLAAEPRVKVACCTYHKAADAQTLASLFDELGYHHEFSDGWMLYKMADEDALDPPYFRHGVLRAKKQ